MVKLDILKEDVDYEGCKNLDEFGDILNNTRLKRKIPIAVVVKTLLISKVYINALEEEDINLKGKWSMAIEI